MNVCVYECECVYHCNKEQFKSTPDKEKKTLYHYIVYIWHTEIKALTTKLGPPDFSQAI